MSEEQNYIEGRNNTLSDNNINQNNLEKHVIVKYLPETINSYLVNKDHERIINPLLPPERRNH